MDVLHGDLLSCLLLLFAANFSDRIAGHKKAQKSQKVAELKQFSCLFAANSFNLIDGHKKAQRTQKVGELKPSRAFSRLFAAKRIPDNFPFNGHKKAQKSRKVRGLKPSRASSWLIFLTGLMATKRLKSRKSSEDQKLFRVSSRLFVANFFVPRGRQNLSRLRS